MDRPTPKAGIGALATSLVVVTLAACGTAAPVEHASTLGSAAGDFGGVVVNESWTQLEPAAGHEKWSDLDASLAAVSSWNAAHAAHPLGVKLRIFRGFTAPTWAKTLGGSPITDGTRTIGRGSDYTSINVATAHHASSVEIWPQAIAATPTPRPSNRGTPP